MRLKKIASGLFIVAAIAAVFMSVANLQAITDWWKLRGYQPDSRIVQLADETTMTGYARRVFYVNHPQLEGKQQFNQNCQAAEHTIVLGCYHSGQNGIFIYDVTAADLQGIEQVTAAHEDLHALYGRLSAHERSYVDGLLEDYYHKDLTDPRVESEIKLYQKTEPNSVVDEMHSVFGTEIADLPAPLENYYKKYFNDRGKVVDYSEHYEQAFTDIENKAKDYDQQLALLKQQINSDEASINLQSQQITTKQQHLNELLASNQTDEYNAQVPAYNDMVKTYNDLVNHTKQEINEYNDLVVERNQLVVQQQELYQEINSNSINTKNGK